MLYTHLYIADDVPSSPLPNVVPNTHPDEPSIPPELPAELIKAEPPPRKLVRRAASRAGSRAPSVPPAEEAPQNEKDAVQEEAPKPARRVCHSRLWLACIIEFSSLQYRL